MIVLERKRVARWVRDQTGHGGWGEWYQAIGHEKNGQLIAGVVFNFQTECDIVMHVAASGPWLTREYVQAVFAYAFVQLGSRRVSACPKAGNHATRKLIEAMGFRLEGTLRHYYPDDDAVIYGLLREECGYIERREVA